MVIHNLTGLTFGALDVLEYTGKTDDGGKVYLCKCKCGNTVEKNTFRLRRYKYGRDCGCGLDARKFIQKEHNAMIELKQINARHVLHVIPETVVITDLRNGAVIITAIDGATHVSIQLAKSTIDRALDRLLNDDRVKQYDLDSETFTTRKGKHKNTDTEFVRVKTIITMYKTTRIITARVNEV